MTEPLFTDGDAQIERALEQLREMKSMGYPFNDPVDRAMLIDLRDRHPRLVLDVEVRKWKLWMMEHKSKRKVMWRVRLETWFTRGSEYAARQGRGSAGAHREGAVQAGPEPADAFGPTSAELEQW